MKRKAYILVMSFVCTMTITMAQESTKRVTLVDWDTTSFSLSHRFNSEYMVPMAAGTVLGLTGSLFAYVEPFHEWSRRLNEEIEYHNLPNLYLDEVLQYLPAVTPIVLSLCGLQGRHKTSRMLMLGGVSYLFGVGWLDAAKYCFAVRRPDSMKTNSFPSGHTSLAFTGAEFLRREYEDEYPAIAVVGYIIAGLVGLMRVWHNRHWTGDVLAGAGLGIVSTSFVYWLLD